MPAFGVYAGRVERPRLETGRRRIETHDAVANIGRRPTFDGSTVSAEAFLLDFAADLYGQRLRLNLVARLRPEQKFSGIDALRAQLQKDVDAARVALAAAP